MLMTKIAMDTRAYVAPCDDWLVGLKMRTIGLKINITQLKDYRRCRAKIDNIS